MNIDIKNEEGSALVYIIIVMVVMSILGTAALNASLSNTKFSIRDEQSVNAYYIAKAGIDAVSKTFKENPDSIKSMIGNATGITGNFADGSYVVKITPITKGIKLVSTGKINGTTITETLALGMNDLTMAAGIFDNVIYNDSSSVLDLSSMSNDTLVGDIKSRGPINMFSGHSYSAIPNSGADYSAVVIPSLTAKTITGSTITSNGNYGDVTVAKNNKLVLDASAGPLTIVMKNLVCNGAIEIKTNGSGVGIVYLFIENSFFLGQNNNSGDTNGLINANSGAVVSNLSVFIQGDSNSSTTDFEIKGGVINAYIYAPDANVKLHNKAQLTGALIAGSYEKQTGADKNYVTYMTPEATLDYSGIISGGYQVLNYSEN